VNRATAECLPSIAAGECASGHHRRVIDYFDQTHNDYRRLWGIDRHAGMHCGYRDALHRSHDAAVENMNRVLARRAAIAGGERVLDAGCGIGGSAVWLARNVGARVTGINLNPRQVLLAKALAARHGVEGRVRFFVADFASTGLPDESFDVVWALESFCYAEDKLAVLIEAARLLRPGGRLILADGFLAKQRLCDDEARIVEHWRTGWAIPHVVGVEAMRTWLAEAGFGSIDFHDATDHVRASSLRIYRTTLALGPWAWLLYALGLRSEVQTRGLASGYYQYQALRRGLGLYGIFCAEKQSDVPAKTA
jgi:SAM-dependent methyltransferase